MVKAPALSVLLPGAILIVAAAIILPTPTTVDARVLQHLMSLTVQILTAGAAAVLVWHAARGFGAQDRERRTWQQINLAVLLWMAGLLLYAVTEWLGHRPSFPSASDLFFVASFLTLGMALGHEFRLVHPALSHRERLVLGGVAVGLWALMIRLLWPILANPLHPMERILDIFYAAFPALLLSLGLGPVLTARSRGAVSAWVAITAGACCLALANLGFVYLNWFDLYADVHPINLLRVAGLAFVIAGGAWRHAPGSSMTAMEAYDEYGGTTPARWRSVWNRGNGRSWKRSPGQDVPRVHADAPLLVSLGVGVVSGTVIALLAAGIWSRRPSLPLATRSPLAEAQRAASAPAAPAPTATSALPGSSSSLRVSQEEFLGILLRKADDRAAMQGLVAVRRRLSGDDPVKLRRQADAYTEAIAKRVETEEHYTIEAMRLLIRASLLAANEIDAERAKKP